MIENVNSKWCIEYISAYFVVTKYAAHYIKWREIFADTSLTRLVSSPQTTSLIYTFNYIS